MKFRIRYFFIALVPVLLLFSSGELMTMLTGRLCVCAMLATAASVVQRLSGRVILCLGMFMAAGAYSFSMLQSRGTLPALFMSIGIVFILALITGFILTPLSGSFFSVASLAAGEITVVLLSASGFFGGVLGIYAIPRYSTPFLSVTFACLAVAAAVVLEHSDRGLACIAYKNDPLSAATSGIPPTLSVMLPFFVCAVICAGAGFLCAGITGFISPVDFMFSRSTDALAVCAVSGCNKPVRTALVACVLELILFTFSQLASWRMLIYGIVLIIITIVKSNRRNTYAEGFKHQ